MTNHFFAIDPQGQAHTRTSKSRSYTHTVVFLRGDAKQASDLARDLQVAAQNAPGSYDFDMSMIDGRWQADTERRHPGLYTQAYWDSQVVKYTKLIGGRTLEQFTAAAVEAARARHDQRVADGYYSRWQNAGWCGRPDLAHKLLAQQGVQAMILEAIAGKPPKGGKA